MSLPPIELCPHCGDYVHKGQIQTECANLHGCTISLEGCPLKNYFAAMLDVSLPYHSNTPINPFTYK